MPTDIFLPFDMIFLVLLVVSFFLGSFSPSPAIRGSSPEGEVVSYGSKSIGKVLRGLRLSQKAKDLVYASLRDDTRKRYDGVLKKWEEFCSQWGENPIHTNIGTVLNFLAERFAEGTGYSSACTARSALNPMVSIEGGGELSAHPLVLRLVKGVFHMRPPLPRYTEVWDVGRVISYLRGLGPNEDLSLKQLKALLGILTCQNVSWD